MMMTNRVNSFGLGIVGLLSLVAASGCGVDSTQVANGGAGGEGATAGTAGAAGSAAVAGSAGQSGNGGEGGSGTSGSGGAAASGGSGGSGQAGSGGQAGTSPGCPAGLSNCDGDIGNGCEDTSVDLNNCGMCGNVCPEIPNANATCSTSGCGYDCKEGYADCNGDPADGCEKIILIDTLHCGMCNNACPGATGANPVCSDGQCGLQCQFGHADCNGDIAADGCEVDITSDATNCGDCGFICPGPAGQTLCSFSSCVIDCAVGSANCDADPENGCETDTNTDVANCGACGQSCGDSACVAGACECAGTSATAQPIPLDMYIMLDKSGSMLEYVDAPNNTITRWDVVTNALSQFFQAPTSTGLGAALQFFPLGGGEPYSCEQFRYSNPAVTMGTLADGVDAQETALVDTLNNASPLGGTPSRVALNGALEYAKLWKVAHPDHKVIVVLATDGEPLGCSSTLVNTADAAANGNSNTVINTVDGAVDAPPIQTYVIGVGSSLNNLNVIAQSGGTQSAFVLPDSGDPAAFIAAMESIRKSALGCDYDIPPAPAGQQFDKTKVNVKLTPGVGSATILTGVGSAGMCDPNTGGWYYDDPNNPSNVVLCPVSCSQVASDTDAVVDIILGCATKEE